MDGVLLKKSLDNTVWVPVVIGHDPPYVSNIKTEGSIANSIFFWTLIDTFHLFNFAMDEAIWDFVYFLCCELYKFYNKTNKEPEAVDTSKPHELIAWLRRKTLDPTEKTELRTRGLGISTFVLAVISRSSSTRYFAYILYLLKGMKPPSM